MPRTMIIGDVHGMDVELQKLLDVLQPTPEDEVVFVGDLVDKGPNSVGVVRMVRELSGRVPVVVVEGNHEDKHRRFRRNLTVRPEVAQGQVDASPELGSITDELSQEDIDFLDGSVLFHRVPEHNLLVVHGGIPGDMTEFPDTLEEASELTGKRKKKMGLLMRTRFVNKDTGKFLQLGKNTPEDPFWTEVWDGRFGHVVFGHQPFMDGPDIREHSTGIDTGSVFGGTLTSMVVDEDGDRSFVSVKSRKFSEVRFD